MSSYLDTSYTIQAEVGRSLAIELMNDVPQPYAAMGWYRPYRER
jgi:hypothetical protein